MKKTLKLAMALVIFMVVVGLTGCGGVKQHIRTDADLPNFTKDKIVIMPASTWGLPGDKLAQSAALLGGFVAAFGKQGVSLQPLQPVLEKMGMGSMSWRMARGMYHMVSFHKTYDFKKDVGYHGSSELPKIIDATAKIISLASKQLKLKFKPKYVAVINVDGYGNWYSFGYSKKLRITCGLYNVKTGLVEKVIIKTKSVSSNEAAILAELATIGGDMKALLAEAPKAEK
ncbi:MAG: hypothetical protein GY714_30520 [Desulfobacterales bacterium]|nr:hypothetical protein [Desulfobacterales bacterium]MCP4161064.1 hypothetical protein [Deltaproteobacteria bacterium]